MNQYQSNGRHDHCGACCSGGCAGCGSVLHLTQGELDLLLHFAELHSRGTAVGFGSSYLSGGWDEVGEKRCPLSSWHCSKKG